MGVWGLVWVGFLGGGGGARVYHCYGVMRRKEVGA